MKHLFKLIWEKEVIPEDYKREKNDFRKKGDFIKCDN